MSAVATMDHDTLLKIDAVVRAAPIIHGEYLRRKLHRFVKAAWPILEPGTPFQDNWHIESICDHLEAVSRGEITRLIINMPPRFMKSLLVSVLWPAWTWANFPERRFLTGSYAKDLATRDAVQARRLMESVWFKERFGFKFRFTSDQNVKTRYVNDKLGHRVTTSVDAAATGEGGDILVVDDPINAKEANSQQARQAAITWWRETMSTRYNDPKTGAAVIVMQRLAEDDLTGYLLGEGGWEHLCFPMRYEKKHAKTTCLGFKDPRKKDGELLFPDRFDETATARLERELGTYATAGQLQQRPTPRGGGVLKSEWFGRYRVLPKIVKRRIYGDTAQKTAERNDYSVFECWGLGEDGKIYLIDMIRGKWEAHELDKKALDFWSKHKPYDEFKSCPLTKMKIEDKTSGTGLIQNLKKKGIPVEGIPRTKDKLTRAYDGQPFLEAGLVVVPEDAPFTSDLCDETDKFTKDDSHLHDDQIDPMLDAINDLLTGKRSMWDAL